jgi:arabinose-5-phosphate isomerase
VKQERAIQLGVGIIQQEIEALRSLADDLGEAFWRCAGLLVECPGLIWVTGIGTSAAVASRLAHLLTDCGARSMALSPGDGLHGHSAVMVPGDVLVALSRGGESSEVIAMARLACRRGVTTVALVHDTGSTLAQVCDTVVPVRSQQDYELMNYVATTSSVVFCAMSDALAAVVLEAKGYTAAELGAAHPGGAVGRMLADGGQDRGGERR